MNRLHFTLLFFISCICRGETPTPLCENPYAPYKLPDHYCTNFNEVCLKKNDPICDNFQNVCKQCPPENYSIITFLDIQNVKNYMIKMLTNINKSEEMEFRMNQIDLKIRLLTNITVQLKQEILEIYRAQKIFSVSIIAAVVILLILLLVEIRFKLISKFKIHLTHESNPRYQFLKSRKSEIYEDVPIIKQQLEGIIKKLEKITDSNSNVTFDITNTKTEIKFKVNKNDCIVQIKKQICSRLSNANDNDYKIMRLKYNGNILDDNRYLLPYITDGNIAVECEIDHSINDQQIVIIKAKGNVNVPKLLQLQKQNTIGDLRTIVLNFFDASDFLITNDIEIMQDESKTIQQYNIKDNDLINIIKKEEGRLIVQSVFNDNSQFCSEYSNSDRISSFVIKIAHKIHSDPNYFVLLQNNQCLDDEKYFFNYSINATSQIKFYCLMRLPSDIKILGEPMDSGYSSKLYRAQYFSNKKQFLIVKFEFPIQNLKQNKPFFAKLARYQAHGVHERIVRVDGLYNDDIYLYIALENMSKGALGTFIKNGAEVKEYKIAKWSVQLLEGLKYLRSQKIYCDDLKPYDIYVDEDENFKILSFNIPGYIKKLMLRFESRFKSLKYLAPEIRNIGPRNSKTVVWSFGVILITIVNNNFSEEDLLDDDCDNMKDQIPKTISEELRDFIKSCLSIDPDGRSTIDYLLESEFIKKYHN